MRPFWAIFQHCRHTLLSRSHVSFLVISQKISVRMEGIRSGMKFRTTISLQWLIEGNLEKELMAWFTRTRQRKLLKRRNIFLDIKYGTELNMLDLLDHHIRLKPQSQTMFLIKQSIKISQCSKNTQKKSHYEIWFNFNEMLIFGAKIKILGEFIINDFFAVKHKMRGFWWFFQPLWKRFWQADEHVTQFYNMALYFIFY